MNLKEKAAWIQARLDEAYPEPKCALNFQNPWQLLVATVLSAQCTDERVNQVTPGLFERYPDPEATAKADINELEEAVRPTGFFRNKAKSLKASAQVVMERHGGKVPTTLEEMVKLPGIGRKTANLILGETLGIPGVVVDTHVSRVSQRLGLTTNKNAEKIEADLMKLFPTSVWTRISNQIIWHGRLVCSAKKPKCPDCMLNLHCVYYRESMESKGD